MRFPLSDWHQYCIGPRAPCTRFYKRHALNDKPMKAFVVSAAALMLLMTGINRAAAGWEGSNGKYCETTCASRGGGVTSARYRDTVFNYYVCRTNAGNEGSRAGYNLKKYGYGERRCVVGFGGTESARANYECLCNR